MVPKTGLSTFFILFYVLFSLEMILLKQPGKYQRTGQHAVHAET